jgi:hypothetical protein
LKAKDLSYEEKMENTYQQQALTATQLEKANQSLLRETGMSSHEVLTITTQQRTLKFNSLQQQTH